MIKKILPIIIILSLVFPSFVQVAQAGVLESTISFTSCTAGGFISGLISQGLRILEGLVRGLFSRFLGGLITNIGGTVPVSDQVVRDETGSFRRSYTAKETHQDIIARCAAREILMAMGRNIMNTARTSGRNGGPAWVRNWRNFQLDAQYRGEDIFRGMLYSTDLCDYFDSDLKSMFGANQNINLASIRTRAGGFDSFQAKTGCTLPDNFDFEAYQQDFSGNGGWEAWSRLLEPQNNFHGALFKSLDEANKQRVIEESADINETAATGFTSIRGRNAVESCSVRNPRNGRCLIYKDILTPAGILSGAVTSGIESELQWVASSDELSEIIASAINVLLNRLTDLSNSNEGDYIVPGEIEVSISPFPPPGGGGGTGACQDPGNTVANYAGNLDGAINAVINSNPGGIADEPNTWENASIFLGYVAGELQSAGFNATTNVLNGNDNPNSGDLIALWQNGDTTAERYDAVSSAGAGDMSIRDAATVGYTGDIPLSCVW
ncbi:MAG: hypothetical protein A2655_03085 [Candidatus Yanofskybacteria bacterium RIFCSPHIGHO2_01_FULL_43_42]|uniref:Uncharacterized protein n=1 Tax=Candidatus Yanofskybacteria bacterium RIFCSPLOWO2_01_FULL_43_22 TaxID=1802695 RepID=A0A1F8GEX1_9BACT|nr:MAG: hypothetical protein A2655_03085 [Candidatus Yanofskybacteria bacterium RIFCSPHIGHO2_01_FULL_43_42]OGN12985.1 MAG: hypothetical protein A3D48_03745 [Candidatus Yanofskybacteria bacterium RIFCSPHIGHO2_02_FULL_43_17]OGN23934.1 MAG: hypothetical protein A3A13_02510 [Candidatus Yanofskybacteria bacterium RIFCSPLOWO2_01_FULL_43_22]